MKRGDDMADGKDQPATFPRGESEEVTDEARSSVASSAIPPFERPSAPLLDASGNPTEYKQKDIFLSMKNSTYRVMMFEQFKKLGAGRTTERNKIAANGMLERFKKTEGRMFRCGRSTATFQMVDEQSALERLQSDVARRMDYSKHWLEEEHTNNPAAFVVRSSRKRNPSQKFMDAQYQDISVREDLTKQLAAAKERLRRGCSPVDVVKPFSTNENGQFELGCTKHGWGNWDMVQTFVSNSNRTVGEIENHAAMIATRYPEIKLRLIEEHNTIWVYPEREQPLVSTAPTNQRLNPQRTILTAATTSSTCRRVSLEEAAATGCVKCQKELETGRRLHSAHSNYCAPRSARNSKAKACSIYGEANSQRVTFHCPKCSKDFSWKCASAAPGAFANHTKHCDPGKKRKRSWTQKHLTAEELLPDVETKGNINKPTAEARTPLDHALLKAGDRVVVLCEQGYDWQATIRRHHQKKGKQGFMIYYTGKKSSVEDWVPSAQVVMILGLKVVFENRKTTSARNEGLSTSESPHQPVAAAHATSATVTRTDGRASLKDGAATGCAKCEAKLETGRKDHNAHSNYCPRSARNSKAKAYSINGEANNKTVIFHCPKCDKDFSWKCANAAPGAFANHTKHCDPGKKRKKSRTQKSLVEDEDSPDDETEVSTNEVPAEATTPLNPDHLKADDSVVALCAAVEPAATVTNARQKEAGKKPSPQPAAASVMPDKPAATNTVSLKQQMAKKNESMEEAQPTQLAVAAISSEGNTQNTTPALATTAPEVTQMKETTTGDEGLTITTASTNKEDAQGGETINEEPSTKPTAASASAECTAVTAAAAATVSRHGMVSNWSQMKGYLNSSIVEKQLPEEGRNYEVSEDCKVVTVLTHTNRAITDGLSAEKVGPSNREKNELVQQDQNVMDRKEKDQTLPAGNYIAIKQEDSDGTEDIVIPRFYYFRLVIASNVTGMLIRLFRRHDHLTFKDLREEIEEYVDLPFESFQFTDGEGDDFMLIQPKQEKKLGVFEKDFDLTSKGDGSRKKPYRVFIQEAK